MKFINSKTKDGLELPGVHWETKKTKYVCDFCSMVWEEYS